MTDTERSFDQITERDSHRLERKKFSKGLCNAMSSTSLNSYLALVSVICYRLGETAKTAFTAVAFEDGSYTLEEGLTDETDEDRRKASIVVLGLCIQKPGDQQFSRRNIFCS